KEGRLSISQPKTEKPSNSDSGTNQAHLWLDLNSDLKTKLKEANSSSKCKEIEEKGKRKKILINTNVELKKIRKVQWRLIQDLSKKKNNKGIVFLYQQIKIILTPRRKVRVKKKKKDP
uniref:Small ribosomal subunit protein eS7 n=1 Tax=Monodelphis domestica TaxID=13616 RepID=A0A5F8H961_MONDO